ncbi:MAG: GTP 3',8-cyclase MoaA [Clostridia bacterium]|nr:GTP 3',8-cyclase MoaA [Clostridia bacterium]
MIDSFGRKIDYLRLSVTKRCNLNCVYCKESESSKADELTPDQIERLVKVFASLGFKKVRLTGGEPLIREDIAEIARRVKAIDGVEKLVLTTNAVRLKEMAKPLKEAGVSAVNISLDTTDEAEYKAITGADCLKKVFEGIDEAEKVGLSPLRINSVLIKGKNEKRAGDLIELARNKKIDVRFIELMPFTDEGKDEAKIVSGEEILSSFPFLKPCENKKATAFEKSVARYYEAEGFKGKIGFITPVSHNFCSECNRIRLLSDGKLRLCLGNELQIDLMPFIDNEKALKEEIEKAVLKKPMSHSFACGYGGFHGMNNIGG